MSLPTLVSRFVVYYQRNGWRATTRRASIEARRNLFSNSKVILYCDLSEQRSLQADLPSSVTIERKRSKTELSGQDLQQIVNRWNPKLACRNIDERFGQGASLWLIKSKDELAGYGWTLKGHTIEPHYFLFGQNDVHLFDFYVLPQYRGQGMNPVLVTHILRNMAAEVGGRAFIEAAEWNRQQLSSLEKTPFRRLGRARKLTMFRHTIVCWDVA